MLPFLLTDFRFPNREREVRHRCTTTIGSHVSTTGIILKLVNIPRICRCLPIGTAKSSPSTITISLARFLRLFYRRGTFSFPFSFSWFSFLFLIREFLFSNFIAQFLLSSTNILHRCNYSTNAANTIVAFLHSCGLTK